MKLGTAVPEDTGLGLATLVEQCICPPGYDGLSCQRCAGGHSRQINNGRVQCVPEQYEPEEPTERPAPRPRPEEECDPNGSIYPDVVGRCVCKVR